MTSALVWYRGMLLDTTLTPTLNADPEDSLDNDIVLSPDDNYLVLKVTEQQYTNLLSAALNGVYTTYPEDYLDVLYPLIKAGKIVFCDQVLQCIETREDIQQAIAALALSSSINGETTEDATALAGQLINDPPSCDNDIIYGMCLQLVEFLNAVSEDILELFVNAPAAIARLGDIIEAIPGVGELPVDDAFQFVESVLEDWNDAYQAAFTEQVKIDLACGLFCIAQEDCTLTLQEARDYYLELLTAFGTYSNWAEFLEDVIAYNWIGTATVYGMHMLILQTLAFGGEVLGFDVNRLLKMVQAMYNDPDPDWSINCTECANWTVTFDLTTDDFDEYLTDLNPSWNATWQSGLGWVMSQDAGGARGGMLFTLPAAANLVEVSYTLFRNLTATNTRQTGIGQFQGIGTWGDTPDYDDRVVNQVEGAYTITVDSPPYTGVESIGFYCGARDGASAVGRISSITISGSGTNPFP